MRAFRNLAAAIAVIAPLAGCGSTAGPHEVGGTIMGGLTGAHIGAMMGRGHGPGQLLTTMIGAGVGAYIGSRIGRSMDRYDREYAMRSANYAMNRLPPGREYSWHNPRSGNRGYVMPTSEVYVGRRGLRCRRFKEVVVLANGRTEVIRGERCMVREGRWDYMA